MIRFDRVHLVRTREMLARQMGIAMGTLRNKKPYSGPGFPASVSSAGARTLLWDGDQVDAFLAGDPVPALPPAEGPDVLLDRQEAAAELGVTAGTWDTYATDQRVAPSRVEVRGVDHWPRGVVQAFRDGRPGKAAASGRPRGSTDAVPRGELRAWVAALLDANPAITIASVREATGAAYASVQRALADLRGERIALLMEADRAMSFDQAADHLGYPPAVRRSARAVTETLLKEA
ncbi:hypothetical protein [Streptomyces sp. NPDC058486]|uniref:hypothetical protein n=1 Tax=unclassified Streptomyces TaxID=2593676 RepID=UPI003650DD06